MWLIVGLNYLYRSSNFLITKAAHQCPPTAGNVGNFCDGLHFFGASDAHLREKWSKNWSDYDTVN